jgi:ketosteroid isomerase-like protein
MNTRRASIFIFLLLCTVASFASAPSGPDSVRDRFLQAFNAGDANGVIALYSDDAVVVSEAMNFVGPQQIRQWIQVSLDQGSKLESIEIERQRTSGDLAYATGRTRRRVGNEIHLGQFLMVLERCGNEWKIVRHFSMNAK